MNVVERRNALSHFQKEVLGKIADTYLATGKGIFARDLYREYGKSKVTDNTKSMVGLIFEVDDIQAISNRLEPTFLGLLIAPSGVKYERKLVIYLEHLESLYKQRDDRQILSGQELEGVLNISKKEAPEFLRLIEKSGLFGGSSYHPSDQTWSITVFRDVDELPDWPSKLDFVYHRAAKFSNGATPVFINDRKAFITPPATEAEGEEGLGLPFTPPNSDRNQIFISYSHKDAKFLEQLLAHLKVLKRANLVTWWSDKQIQPGSEWQAQIQAALERAKISVMMVSQHFLASDFIHNHELGPLLKRAEQNGVKLLWIPVRACSYKDTPPLQIPSSNST